MQSGFIELRETRFDCGSHRARFQLHPIYETRSAPIPVRTTFCLSLIFRSPKCDETQRSNYNNVMRFMYIFGV